jgi:hypothetical protein
MTTDSMVLRRHMRKISDSITGARMPRVRTGAKRVPRGNGAVPARRV